ncbi:rhomboid family intramembrane serine protease [Nocardia beijingensis]|uniref:rhomboid family intramembrane serine protease n=1 Tax=Nocardia beijingensis TaxID=95162 RepID=UPI001894EF5F|nr:rhomboid family intramembrane serine protease [Nocardia beijingensis]
MTGAGLGPSFDPERLAALRAHTGKPAGAPMPSAGGFAAIKQLWLRAGVLIAGFVGVLYGVEGVDTAVGGRLDHAGIEPRSADGLTGILFAPLLHGGWPHLIGNTLPVLVLGFLVLVTGIGRGLAATAIIWLGAGLGVWLTGATGSTHIGASSLVFGWLTFLISRGWFARNVGQIVLGLVVLALYGSLLWGVLPGPPGISWQGHLFGAVSGLLAGWVLSSDARRNRRGNRAGTGASPR